MTDIGKQFSPSGKQSGLPIRLLPEYGTQTAGPPRGLLDRLIGRVLAKSSGKFNETAAVRTHSSLVCSDLPIVGGVQLPQLCYVHTGANHRCERTMGHRWR